MPNWRPIAKFITILFLKSALRISFNRHTLVKMCVCVYVIFAKAAPFFNERQFVGFYAGRQRLLCLIDKLLNLFSINFNAQFRGMQSLKSVLFLLPRTFIWNWYLSEENDRSWTYMWKITASSKWWMIIMYPETLVIILSSLLGSIFKGKVK